MKLRIGSLTLIVLAMSASLTGTSALAQTDHLIANWTFDETGITTGSTIADGSGNGHNGTVVGTAPTSGVAGMFGTAFTFPGGTNVPGTNGYISVPYDPGFSGLNQLTLSCWINIPVVPSGINPREAMFSMDSQLEGTNSWVDCYAFGWPQHGYQNRLSAVIGTSGEYDGPSGYPSTNAWHLVTMVYDGGNKSSSQWFAYCYLDGVQLFGAGGVPTPDVYGPFYLPTAAAGQPLILGADFHQFGGSMDDLGVWNTALTGGVPTSQGNSSGELAALYNTPMYNNHTGALAQYGVSAMDKLFNLYNGASTSAITAVTTNNGELAWKYVASGLSVGSGSASRLANGRYVVQLDANGGGVETLMPGDANLDDKVDINDLTIVLANYGKTGATWTTGDFTGSGVVDINDLTIVLANYNQSYSASAGGLAAVPEPSAVLPISGGLVALLAYAWRRRISL